MPEKNAHTFGILLLSMHKQVQDSKIHSWKPFIHRDAVLWRYDREMLPFSTRHIFFFYVANTFFISVQMVIEQEEMPRDATKISVSVLSLMDVWWAMQLIKKLRS